MKKEKFSVNHTCPCGNKKKYKKCCQVYHNGKIPDLAEALMRSRYTAYVLKNPKYIMKTTHYENPDYITNKDQWENDILLFSEGSIFNGLEIIEVENNQEISYVTFKVSLMINNKDESFCERSKFLKVGNRWLYHSGIIK